MIRRLVLCSTAVLAALATTASAAPPHITDAKGDWHVPSQDIVSGGLSTDGNGRIVVALKLAAPLAAVPGFYHVVLYRGCDAHVVYLEWRGAALPRTSGVESSRWCSSEIAPGVLDPRPAPATDQPAAATVTGDTIRWTLPPLAGLAKGAVVDYMAAVVTPNPEIPVGFWAGGSDIPSVAVNAFDVGFGNREYVVGR